MTHIPWVEGEQQDEWRALNRDKPDIHTAFKGCDTADEDAPGVLETASSKTTGSSKFQDMTKTILDGYGEREWEKARRKAVKKGLKQVASWAPTCLLKKQGWTLGGTKIGSSQLALRTPVCPLYLPPARTHALTGVLWVGVVGLTHTLHTHPGSPARHFSFINLFARARFSLGALTERRHKRGSSGTHRSPTVRK